jgi:hypothetical protein
MRRLDAVTAQNFRLREELLTRGAAKRSLQARLRFQPLESKFHRNSDFETPVAVFILQVE